MTEDENKNGAEMSALAAGLDIDWYEDTGIRKETALDRIADCFDDIQKLHASGLTWKEIAAALAKGKGIRVTPDTLKVYMHRLRRAAQHITEKVSSVLFRKAENDHGKPVRKRGPKYQASLIRNRRAAAQAQHTSDTSAIESAMARVDSRPRSPATRALTKPSGGGIAPGFMREEEKVKDFRDY